MAEYETKAEIIEDEIRTINDNLRAMHGALNEDVAELQRALAAQDQELKSRLGGLDGLTADKVERVSSALSSQQEANDRLARRLNNLEVAVKRVGSGEADGPAGAGVSHKAAHDFHLMTHARRFGPDRRFDPDQVDEQKYADYCRGFDSYLRRDDRTLSAEEVKALSVGSDPDGGYYAPSQVAARIVERQFEASPMRGLAAVETISASSLEIPVSWDEAEAGWVSESENRPETDHPRIKLVDIPAHEIYAQPLITQKLLDDASIDMESWLVGRLADRFARIENAAFFAGDGVGKPRGFLTYPDGTSYGEIEQVASGADGSITYDGLVDLLTSLKSAHLARAQFVFGRAAMAQVLKLKDSSDQPLWQPSIQAGQPSTLMGRPVTLAEGMPDPDTDSLSLAIGDFQAGYTVVDRMGIGILRDPFTKKPYVKIYATKRVGGAVVDFDAIKLQKLNS